MFENKLLEFIAVFIVTSCVDAVWALYMMRVAEKKAFMSAVYGAIIIASGGIIAIAYVNNHIMLIAAVFGGFVGTYLTVKKSKKDATVA